MPSRFTHFTPSILETEENLEFCDYLRGELKSSAGEVPFFNQFVPVLEASCSSITALQKRVFGSAFTPQVKSSDTRRGSLYNSIITNLKDDIKFADVDPEAAAAAEIVLNCFTAHPVDTKGSYAVESQGYRQVFSELDKIPEAVAGCSAARRIAALRAEQDQFDLWRAKQTEDIDSQLRGKVRDAEQDLWLKMDIVLSHLEGQAMIDADQFEPLAQRIQDRITQVMAPAKARETKKESTAEA